MDDFNFSPIGYMKTCYSEKNGTPRQPSVSSVSKGNLTISKSFFNNPEHSIEGLAEFSHVWILFVFHLNSCKSVKAKVKPPRLNGSKVGVFSTRSPHRPNPVGLTLAKLDSIENDTLYFSGVDIVNNTPILDIKPYIDAYDQPQSITSSNCGFTSLCSVVQNRHSRNTQTEKQLCETASPTLLEKSETSNSISSSTTCVDEHDAVVAENHCISVAKWIQQPPISNLTIVFSNRALNNLAKFKAASKDQITVKDWCLHHIQPEELKQAITDVLFADPRSSYRRKKCSDRLYYFTLDNAHVTTWFDETMTPHCAEVLRVVPKCLINLA